jgi:predicted 2-oxoglutarate/Fe(II)-dependent dioxygenase YbiX
MNPEIFAEKIYYYKGAIKDPKELVEMIEITDANLTDKDVIEKWHEWVASGEGEKYVFGQQKFTDESKLDTSSAIIGLIYLTLKDALTRVGKDYAEKNGIKYIDPAPISISKYVSGAEMGPHVDYHGEPHLEPIMSAVMYLNDDMEGGELHFTELDIKIKPEAGSIVVFPSVEPFYHRSTPVVSGVKYMSPAFWIKKLDN